MSDEERIVIREAEKDELYVLLASMETRLSPELDGLKRRLERVLYEGRSIEEMERLIARAGGENR